MTTLKVDGMHCNMCVARINKALDAAKIAHEVKLEDKTVTIANDGEREKAVQALDDIGFEAKKSVKQKWVLLSKSKIPVIMA